MKTMDEINKFLPLSESTFYIMLALVEPLHGYGVMQKAAVVSKGTVDIGPGTLYGAFQTLEKEGLIVKVGEEDRRKIYQLTDMGLEILKEQIRRLEIMHRSGSDILSKQDDK